MFIRNTREEAVLRTVTTEQEDKDEKDRYTANNSYVRSQKRFHNDDVPVFVDFIFTALVVMFNITIFVLFVWALVFGITDINNNGFNVWAVVWIVLGAIGVISFIRR